jgi:DinB superfamily
MGDKDRFNSAVREHLGRLLTWEDSQVGFDTAIAGIPPSFRGKTPKGGPYSIWQLLEHMRRAQHDILDFCQNPNYKELHWPDDYWPETAAPPSPKAWNASVRDFQQDRETFVKLAKDPKVDLTAKIPHGQGQTYLREIILAADHAAYHVGELVLVRKLLGIWK